MSRGAKLIVLTATAGGLAGCSIAVPMASDPSVMWNSERVASDVTSAIPKSPPKLSGALDSEDQRRAIAALSTALDPQGSGTSVNWDNPQSGAKGSFTPVGQPYPLEGRICRAFHGDIVVSDTQESLQGAACREKTAEWALTEVKRSKKG